MRQRIIEASIVFSLTVLFLWWPMGILLIVSGCSHHSTYGSITRTQSREKFNDFDDQLRTVTEVDPRVGSSHDAIGTLVINGCEFAYYRGHSCIDIEHLPQCKHCQKIREKAADKGTVIPQRAAQPGRPTPIIDGIKGDPFRNMRADEMELLDPH